MRKSKKGRPPYGKFIGIKVNRISGIALGSLVAASTLAPAIAADPFVPGDVPLCSSSIHRGAQNALDDYMNKLLLSKQAEDFDLQREFLRIRGQGLDTAGVEAAIRVKNITWNYKFKTASSDKIYELQKFALKKYKCLVELFYMPPTF